MTQEAENKTPTSQIISWAAGQPFNNVLLLGILAGGCYAAVALVPIHLTQIQTGYEKIDATNKAMLERMANDHREERERTLQLYDKWMNRTSTTSGSASKVASSPHEAGSPERKQ